MGFFLNRAIVISDEATNHMKRLCALILISLMALVWCVALLA
jgi:hypothetical protein